MSELDHANDWSWWGWASADYSGQYGGQGFNVLALGDGENSAWMRRLCPWTVKDPPLFGFSIPPPMVHVRPGMSTCPAQAPLHRRARQQPKPLVEKLYCLLSFPILYPNRFRPKMEPWPTVWGNNVNPLTQTFVAPLFRFHLLTNIRLNFWVFQNCNTISDIHVYVWLLFWQKSRNELGFLYNFSLGQQNDLILWAFILSRRWASSEPHPCFKTIWLLWNQRTSFRKTVSKPPLLFYWLLPRGGITSAYWPE